MLGSQREKGSHLDSLVEKTNRGTVYRVVGRVKETNEGN